MANKFTAGWTPAEDQILRDMYVTNCASLVAQNLPGRTLGAVYRRAVMLGLKRLLVAAPPRNRSRRARVNLEPLPNVPGQSVAEWLAAGGVIEYPEPRPFLRIKPSAVKAHPCVSPMRVIGRAA